VAFIDDDDEEELPVGAKAALDRDYEQEDDDELEEGEPADDQGDGEEPPADGEDGEEAEPTGDEPPADDDELEDPDPAAAAPPAPTAGDGEDDWQPYTFRAGGRLMEIDGAVVGKDGLYIPAEKVSAVTEAIQRGVHHQTTFQQELAKRDRQVAELDPEHNEKVIEAQAVLDFLEPRLKDAASLQAFVANFATEKAMMLAEVRAKKAEARAQLIAKHPQLAQPAEAEPSEEQFRELAVSALWQHFDDQLDRGEFRGVFQAGERKALQAEIARAAPLYVIKAPHDDPAQGIRAGERVIDVTRLVDDIRRYAERSGRVRPAPKNGQPAKGAADRAAAANRAALRSTKPPTGGKRAGPAKRSSQPRSREEWMKGISSMVRDLSSDS
jgi:hypothetical protein